MGRTDNEWETNKRMRGEELRNPLSTKILNYKRELCAFINTFKSKNGWRLGPYWLQRGTCLIRARNGTGEMKVRAALQESLGDIVSA